MLRPSKARVVIEIVILITDYTSCVWRFELHVLFLLGLLYELFCFIYISFLQIHRSTCTLYHFLFTPYVDVSPNLMLNHLETILQDHS